jgi:hypothetical protein
MPDEKEKKEEEIYVFSPEELIEGKEPEGVGLEMQKVSPPTEVIKVETKEEPPAESIKKEPTPPSETPKEHPISEIIVEEKIEKELKKGEIEITEKIPKESLGYKLGEKPLEIPKELPEIKEISFLPEEGKKYLDLGSLIKNIPWKLIGLSSLLIILLFAGYSGFSYLKEKRAKKALEEEKKKVKIELPVEVQKATPISEAQVPPPPSPKTQEIVKETPPPEAPKEIPQKKEEVIKEETKKEETKATPTITLPIETPQKETKTYTTYQIITFDWLNQYTVETSQQNLEGVKEAIQKSLSRQGRRFSLEQIRFVYKDKDLPGSLIQEYFLHPSFASQDQFSKFIQSLSLDYAILYYYTYTQKYPLFIWKVNDPIFIKTFMLLWEKESLVKDSLNFYFGLNRGKPVSSFQEFIYKDIPYRMLKFSNNNFRLIWSIYKNMLIFSTSQAGFESFIDQSIKNEIY